MENNAVYTAEKLLETGAVTLSEKIPYTWSSGLKSPIYCDNRILLSYPAVRKKISRALAEAAAALNPDVIAGTATAGIPHAAWVADILDLPMVYVRAAEKSHGRKNKIEGHLPPGSRVVVIEDLISTGASAVKAADAVEEAGAETVGIQAIFTYGLEESASVPYPLSALTDLNELLQAAGRTNLLTVEEQSSIREWQKNPARWGTKKEMKA
ncbi:orotate phosphoribosyltransferase [Alkalicoccus urumqiensis]|uniref:Orotate phosphoribosyltransferase n=1 Tax=Alkalicoccus urumqiensis TaxID=1548213 RepID=A0A2P6MGA3_ALKUR|nr:orotate phosphoribosyltransferase [Alkalicoccus urumqiensis]PRO65293.1 orotate phosphoribosyltransferase [Alkalicoccus urumqiensis]